MPGIGDEIEGAMQHAAQPDRQLQGISGIGSSNSEDHNQALQCKHYSQRNSWIILK